jgi:hypothetical protein
MNITGGAFIVLIVGAFLTGSSSALMKILGLAFWCAGLLILCVIAAMRVSELFKQ